MTMLREGLVVVLRSALVLLIALAALLAAGVLLAPATGHRVVVLRSGSMAPGMPVGSLALIESVEPGEVRAGDVVTVALESGSLLTHRVVREASLDGYPALVLHGDGNAAAEVETVSLDRLVGRVVAVVPVVGYAVWWMSQPAGLAASVALIGLVLVAIGGLGLRERRQRRRHRHLWRRVRRGRFGAQAAVLERGLWLGLDRPILALLLALVLAAGGGSTLKSAAIFTDAAGVGGNTFTTGTWSASDYRSVATGPWSAAATWERYNGLAWVTATRPPSSIDGVVSISPGNAVTATADVAVDQVVVVAGGQLTVADGVSFMVGDGTGTDVDVSGTLDAVGTLTVSAGAEVAIESGGVLQDSGAIDGTGSITAVSGTIQANGGSRTITNPISMNPGLIVAGSDDLTLGGVLAGTGTLTKTGTGTLVLAGANTYTGATTVSGGTLALGTANAIGASSAVTVAASATLDLEAFSDAIGSLAGAGTLTSTTAGTATLTAGGNNTSTTFSGLVADGLGQVALAKAGTGTLVLSGANTYTGTTTVSAGTLSIAADAALGTAPAAPVAGQLTIGTATLATTATATLAASRGITLTGTATLTGTGTTLTVPGIVAGSGALTKTGTGTLVLAGANTYTGATTVSGGRLNVNGSIGAGAVSVAAGATLGGSGTIAGTVSITGTLQPGSSPGRLTNGALTFVANSTYSIEIGGTTPATQFDQDRVSSGGVTIGSTVTLSPVAINGFTPTLGQTFMILDKAAAGAISGTFNGLAQGATIPSFLGSALRAQISYTGGDGNDVVLTVVP